MTTTKQRIPLALARIYATLAKDKLGPYCGRIEVAGSIRRERESVGDVEIVCIPKPGKAPEPPTDLFGNAVGPAPKVDDELTAYLRDQIDNPTHQAAPIWELRPSRRKDGRETTVFGLKNKLLLLNGFACDVFSVTDDTWGMGMFVRTGEADWNRIAAKRLMDLGMKLRPYEGVTVEKSNTLIRVPDEATLFGLLRWPETSPNRRTAERALEYVRRRSA